jgi:hypothetical protein
MKSVNLRLLLVTSNFNFFFVKTKYDNVEIVDSQTVLLLAEMNDQSNREEMSIYYTQTQRKVDYTLCGDEDDGVSFWQPSYGDERQGSVKGMAENDDGYGVEGVEEVPENDDMNGGEDCDLEVGEAAGNDGEDFGEMNCDDGVEEKANESTEDDQYYQKLQEASVCGQEVVEIPENDECGDDNGANDECDDDNGANDNGANDIGANEECDDDNGANDDGDDDNGANDDGNNDDGSSEDGSNEDEIEEVEVPENDDEDCTSEVEEVPGNDGSKENFDNVSQYEDYLLIVCSVW